MNEKIIKLLKSKSKYVILIFLGIILLVMPTNNEESNGSDDLELNLKATLEMAEGVGEIDVMITCDKDNSAEGAIIVAEGAENISVKKMLRDAAVSVLNLPEHKVQVITKKK